MSLRKMLRLFLVPYLFLVSVRGQGYYEGEACSDKGELGVCKRFRECQTAIDAFYYQKIRVQPKICSWRYNEQIVCCFDGMGNRGQQQQSRTTTSCSTRTTTTTEYVPVLPEYDEEGADVPSCKDLAPNITAPRTGQKAWDKCIDYQENLVYPCNKSMALIGGYIRHNYCHHATDPLILGGEDAADLEFPHMVLLGFVDPSSSTVVPKWECGGTIISERWILTAGHCTSHRDYKEVKFIRAGALKRSSPYERQQIYRVVRIEKHPSYASPNKYHDIALLKTDRAMQLDSTMVPACLDLGRGVDDNIAIVTGWGSTKQNGYVADTLQKVTLNKFTAAQCSFWYRKGLRNMEDGYQDAWQTCYGDPLQLDATKKKNQPSVDFKDSCQGDSGGPVVVRNSVLSCMYTVVGITSFGKGCGNGPGIYTRVSYYVPWISSVVWPVDPLEAV